MLSRAARGTNGEATRLNQKTLKRRPEEKMKTKTKSDELSKKIAAIRKEAGGDTHKEVLDVYLEGYADGYNKAIDELTKQWEIR